MPRFTFKQNNFNAIWWSFSGGEVTFNPSYLPILEEIQQYDTMLMNLTTNLSQSIKWWEKFSKCTKNFHHVKVNGSWHGEYLKDVISHISGENVIIRLNTPISATLFTGEKEEDTKTMLLMPVRLNS